MRILAAAFAALAGYLWLGAGYGWERWRFLEGLPLSAAPAYLLAGRLVWGAVFAALAGGLWWDRRWARLAALAGLALFLAHGWLDRLWLARSDFAALSLPFQAAWTPGALALAAALTLRLGRGGR